MSKKDMLFIYNPKAGKAQIRNHLVDILDIFVKEGYEVTVYPTQARGDAIKMTRRKKEKYDIVVCSGGDGTLDEVFTGMMQCKKKVPIGYIPAGSTNDFAMSLNIPKNMVQAAETVVDGETYAVDVGMFNDDVFVYIAAFGLFTEVSYETDQQAKNVLGHVAYLLEGMKRLAAIKSYKLKVTVNDEVIEDEFIFGMITNSYSVGGFQRITGNNVELDDGEFEITLIKKPQNPIELNRVMAALVDRDIDAECMYCFKASEVHIESEEEVSWTLDGEFGGSHKEVTVKNLHKSLEIRVPHRV